MKSKPLISVLIPTYNVYDYIEEAIQSIISQTYKNLEIIVIDDCSTDGTYEKLQEIKEKDDRIQIFRNKENLKIAETLNFALSVSNGDYIARMDGDDISTSDRIEKQLDFLKANPEVDLVGLQFIVINEQGIEIKRTKSYSESPEKALEQMEFFPPVSHFWLAKRSVYEAVGSYRISSVEDYDFLLRMATLNLKFCSHPEYLYKYRIRNGNTTTSSGLTQRKCTSYIRQLYRERLNSPKNEDSFSESELIRRKKTNIIESKLFEISNRFMYEFGIYIQQNKIKAAIYFFLAIIFSPIHQSRYFINKNKYNRILNK